MNTLKSSLSAILLSTLLLVSCSKDDSPAPDPTAGLVKVADGFAAGAATRVQLYTESAAIETGYTRLYVLLKDSVSGAIVPDAHVHLMPMMDMGTMKHSAPVENPETTEPTDGLFEGAVVFIMPSTGGSWTLTVEVHNHGTDKEGEFTTPLTVVQPTEAKLISYTGADDGGKYFIALIEPSKPKIGINDFEIGVYRKASMMSFPADSSLRFTIEPEMPTMGHGSPNNVNPTHLGQGHYQGKVNFTMTGLWRVHLDAMHGTAVSDTTHYFDIEF